MQAIKIINYRMKNNNSDNMKPETVNINTLVQEIKESKNTDIPIKEI
jgi:hypothetical protein